MSTEAQTQQNKQVPQNGAPAARIKVKSPMLAMMGLLLGGFTGMYSETALNIALPQLSEAFSIDTSITQWLVIGYMLVISIVLPLSSLLTKWFQARKIAMFAVGAFFCWIADQWIRNNIFRCSNWSLHPRYWYRFGVAAYVFHGYGSCSTE